VRWQASQSESRLKNVVTEEDNPLPRSFEVKVINPDNLDSVAKIFDTAEVKPMITKTSLNENRSTIQRLVGVTKFIRKVGLAFSLFFIFISIMVVFNTIRLAIYSRRDEIDVMKLVGASPSFIRWPFLLEGILYGILATILSSILLYFAFRFLSPFANRYLGDIMNQWGGSFMAYFNAHLWEIILWQLLVGILIGLGCSYFAIRKHLKIV
jgi:cell division transport system permease protein